MKLLPTLLFLISSHILMGQSDGDRLFRAGDSIRVLADFASAREVYKEAIAAYRIDDDIEGELRVGISLARMDLVEKEYVRAQVLVDSVLEIALANQFGQVAASCYNLKGAITGEYESDFALALEYHKRALAALDTISRPAVRETRARTIGTMGVCYLNMGDFDAALAQYAKAVDTLIAITGPGHPAISIGYSSIADVLWLKAEYDSAISYYNKSLFIQSRALPRLHPLNISVYRDLGECYADKGDPGAAMDNYRLALDIAVNMFGPESHDAARLYHKMTRVRMQQGDSVGVEEELLRALAITETVYGPMNGSVDEVVADLAQYYLSTGQSERADEYLRRSLLINKRIRPDHPATMASHVNLARFDHSQRNYQEALAQLDSAMTIGVAAYGRPHPRIATVLIERGKVLRSMGRNEEAIRILNEAKDECRYSSGAAVSKEIMQVLVELLRVEGQSSQAYYDHVRDGFDHARRVLIESTSSDSRDFWLERLFPFYVESMQAIYSMYDASPSDELAVFALDIAERSKSSLLRSHLQRQEGLVRGGIPVDLFDLELSLRKDIRFYTALMNDPENQDSEQRTQLWESKLRDTRVEYDSLWQELRKTYPGYYDLSFGTEALAYNDLANQLRKQSKKLLQFFESTDAMYLIVADGKDISLHKIDSNKELETAISNFKRSITDPQSELIEFRTSAGIIGSALLEPFLNGDSSAGIIISPDGMLYGLPFEAMVSSSTGSSWRDLNYIINDRQVQYLYLVSDLYKARSKGRQKKAYVGFAPDYKGVPSAVRSEMGDLPNARSEVLDANAIWGGELYLDSNATRTNFIERSPGSRIVHLAMHAEAAVSDPMASRLLFTRNDSIDPLHIYEIYDLELDNDIAILSACETGVGQFRKGEGLTSMARAFRYAGVSSIAMSLWKVSDHATRDIVTGVMRHLRDGENASQALANSKLEYLRGADALRAHPYYWAGMVQVGPDVDQRRGVPLAVLAIAGALILGLIVFVLFKRR